MGIIRRCLRRLGISLRRMRRRGGGWRGSVRLIEGFVRILDIRMAIHIIVRLRLDQRQQHQRERERSPYNTHFHQIRPQSVQKSVNLVERVGIGCGTYQRLSHIETTLTPVRHLADSRGSQFDLSPDQAVVGTGVFGILLQKTCCTSRPPYSLQQYLVRYASVLE
jgi:hypothetical protein